MSLEWLKSARGSRSFVFATMLALASGAGLGCAAEDGEEGGTAEEEGGASTDDITNGDTAERMTEVKRQSIGNCWLYAVASWAEGMNKRATGEDLNVSESYLTYWHWFEQIANGGSATEISTGGSYAVATGLIDRYGIMKEGDFLPNESSLEMSAAQARAETYINNSLKNGALKERDARRNRETVRAELNKAFGVDASRQERMNRVFGRAVTRTIDRSYLNRRPGYEVFRAKDVVTAIPNATTHQSVNVTLQDAIGTGSTWSRSGEYAHQEIDFPYSPSGYRAFQQRIQRALHDGAIPVMSWKVDFNALNSESVFSLQELARRGPGINGRQGGHMVVINDYDAVLADGTKLAAGTDATPAQLEAALATDTKINFFRVKNSWGADRPDRWQNAAVLGYHDLNWDYLVGPIKDCPEDATNASQCTGNAQVWWDVVLPQGY